MSKFWLDPSSASQLYVCKHRNSVLCVCKHRNSVLLCANIATVYFCVQAAISTKSSCAGSLDHKNPFPASQDLLSAPLSAYVLSMGESFQD